MITFAVKTEGSLVIRVCFTLVWVPDKLLVVLQIREILNLFEEAVFVFAMILYFIETIWSEATNPVEF